MLSDSKPLFLEIQENQRDSKGLGVIERDRKTVSRMIVSHDDSGRLKLQRWVGDLARIDRRGIDGAGLMDFVGDQVIALVDEKDTELLDASERHGAPQVTEHGGLRAERIAGLDLAAQDAMHG